MFEVSAHQDDERLIKRHFSNRIDSLYVWLDRTSLCLDSFQYYGSMPVYYSEGRITLSSEHNALGLLQLCRDAAVPDAQVNDQIAAVMERYVRQRREGAQGPGSISRSQRRQGANPGGGVGTIAGQVEIPKERTAKSQATIQDCWHLVEVTDDPASYGEFIAYPRAKGPPAER
ncbi:MAG TPA: hypothetical protein VMC79_01710 [Rectinemataceae bacterium]|nr:hypothetical protein [Rectinemataceae bacterium]